MERLLIVNADDFGLSKGQNYGIIEACRNGIVTSTTALVNGQAIDHAVQLSRDEPSLAIGMHFVLTMGKPLTAMPGLTRDGVLGKWIWQLAEEDALPLEEITQELASQYLRFIELFGRKPTHLDSHHHVHMFPQILIVQRVDLLHLYEQAPLWFDNPGSSFVLVVLFAIWRYFPYAFISFLAILQTIDKSLYEAAEMDGANAWQRFRIVTLPAIMPVLATVVTLRTIWMFYMFADVYLLTTKVDILGVYLYKTAFAFNDLGKAAAISVVLFIIIFAVILLTRKRVNLNGNK